jgi:coenzyme PQQ synthesis protein D (PqqD)
MRVKGRERFVLRTIAGSHVLVPVGDRVVDFNGVVVLNGTGRFLWERIAAGCEAEHLVDDLVDAFAVSREEAARDVTAFVAELSAKGLLDADARG